MVLKEKIEKISTEKNPKKHKKKKKKKKKKKDTHSQKWTLEWLKMSACGFRLWKHCGDRTIPTSSPPSKSGTILRKNSLDAT